jgi:DNA (cytosine-5)-methyltransferase 1
MKIGSAFSGVGGLELGLSRGLGGARVAWQIEIDAFCRRVLAARFPDALRYEDIENTNFTRLEPVDVLCGGFPCHNISVAGDGDGLHGAHSRLWFPMLRCIKQIRPRYVVIENSPALHVRGLSTVTEGLRAAGYQAEFGVRGASDLGAPHVRKRMFVLASRLDVEPARIFSHVELRPDVWPRSREDVEPWERGEPRALGRDVKLPNRRARIHALGNAVVPAVAELLGHAIAARGHFALAPSLSSSLASAEYADRGARVRAARWPTLTAQDAKNDGGPSQHRRNTKPLNALVDGLLNPRWCELLMGYPAGWTEPNRALENFARSA